MDEASSDNQDQDLKKTLTEILVEGSLIETSVPAEVVAVKMPELERDITNLSHDGSTGPPFLDSLEIVSNGTPPHTPQVASPNRQVVQKEKKKFSNIFIPAAQPDEQDRPSDRIRLGICAMDKKARSKPMAEILSRLDQSLFRVVFFGDDVILNQPIEEWPHCDVLVAFHSTGTYPTGHFCSL
jgi:hypothetical protein